MRLDTLAVLILRGIVRGYQLFLSPLLGCNCRFEPSCSHYAIEALSRFGVVKGSWLTLRRVIRCHPWGGSGFDPVPQARQDLKTSLSFDKEL